MKKHVLKTIGLLALSWQLQAADRALIIGITEYQQPKYNLPGIDLDVGMGQKIAKMLNFESAQTKTITGKEATAQNIKTAIKDWLVNGTNADDRVFVYYSGHGGRLKDKNSDEKDGQDEYITAYDLKDKASEGGYILDDDLSKLLNDIRSTNKVIMLDSCHSGTATRSIVPVSQNLGDNVLFSKKHTFGKASEFAVVSKGQNSGFLDGHPNLITLAAAHDFEAAQATKKGSLFTLGFYEALSKAAQEGANLSAQDLVDQAGHFIENKLSNDPDLKHKPLIFGDYKLAQKALLVKPSRNGNGPNWQELKNVAKLGKPLSSKSNKSVYNEGELIEFQVELPMDGYLQIINVDAHDKVTVLFPNPYYKESFVAERSIKIPGKYMPFKFFAKKPSGDSLTLFLLTSKPMNLYKEGLNVRNVSGSLTGEFSDLSEVAYRGIGIQASNPKNDVYTTSIQTTMK
ncbi:MAG: caspase family protein [Marinicella sp.]